MDIPVDVVEMTMLNNGVCMGVTHDDKLVVWNNERIGTIDVCDAVDAINTSAAHFISRDVTSIISDMSMLHNKIPFLYMGSTWNIIRPRAYATTNGGFYCMMRMKYVSPDGRDNGGVVVWGHLDLRCEPRH